MSVPISKMTMNEPLSPLRGTRTLLMAPTGCGKSTCALSLHRLGIELFVLATENNSLEIFSPVKGVRVHSLIETSYSWKGLLAMATNVSMFDQSTLMKIEDSNRRSCVQFLKLLESLNDFVDDKTGIHYGDISTWGTGRCIFIDGLTGLNGFSKRLVVGGRPILAQADWQIGQNIIYPLIEQLTMAPRCWVVMSAHLEQERDEILGTNKNMPSTLGRKLAPTIPPLFTDVIRPKKVADKFYWSTSDPSTDLAARNLPLRDDLPPTFDSIVQSWKQRGGIIETSPTFEKT